MTSTHLGDDLRMKQAKSRSKNSSPRKTRKSKPKEEKIQQQQQETPSPPAVAPTAAATPTTPSPPLQVQQFRRPMPPHLLQQQSKDVQHREVRNTIAQAIGRVLQRYRGKPNSEPHTDWSEVSGLDALYMLQEELEKDIITTD